MSNAIPPTQTWVHHKCESTHRTAGAFMACALGTRRANRQGSVQPSPTQVIGTGLWAVVHNHYLSGYGRNSNHEYTVRLYETDKAAENAWMAQHNYCNADHKCCHTCAGLSPYIVGVVL